MPVPIPRRFSQSHATAPLANFSLSQDNIRYVQVYVYPSLLYPFVCAVDYMTSLNFLKFYLLFELTQLRFIPYIFSLKWMGNNREVKIAGGKNPDGKSREGNVRLGNDWAAERLDPFLVPFLYVMHMSAYCWK